MRSYAGAAFSLALLVVALAPWSWAQTDAPTDETVFVARRLFRQGDFQGAAAAFLKIIERAPSPQAYAGLVQSSLKQDDVKAAEKSSQRAMEAFPQSALAHATRGDVYFRRGLMPDAENEYKTALNPDEQ